MEDSEMMEDETELIQITDVQSMSNMDNMTTDDWSQVLETDQKDSDKMNDEAVETTPNVSEEKSPKSLLPDSPSEASVSHVRSLTDESGVTPSDFLCTADETEAVNTDSQLEALTPSKVLEDNTTENSQMETNG